MANPYRGEVSLVVNGEERILRLTLGALAELESELEQDNLLSLVERFECGEFRTRDLTRLLAAGLRTQGWVGNEQDLLNAVIDGGPMAAARCAGKLLKLTFGPPD